MQTLRHLTIVASLLLWGCSGRMNNFGDIPDAGPADAADIVEVGADLVDQPHTEGELCSGPSSCEEGTLCIGTRAQQFRCMRECETPYDLCTDGSVCLPVSAHDASICYIGGVVAAEASCANNLDCASGLLCFGSGSQFYCREACDESEPACPAGQYCLRVDSGAALCREEIGAPCSTAACAASLSCSLDDAELSGYFPGGYCTLGCSSDSDCPGASACVRFPGSSKSTCVGSCDHDSDCRFNAGYLCLDAAACASSAEPAACQTFFGDQSLCLAAVP